MTDSYEYRKWAAMRSECYNAKYRNYKFFGDRGIVMSEEWKNSFVAFKKDIGERPSTAHFISRIDKNGNYCKENCEWVKKTERVVKTIEYKGVSGTVSKWAKKFKIDKDTVNKRLRLGWSIEQALETPLNKRRKAKIKTTCVYLNLPDDLVKKIDKFAKKNKISRSGIVKKILSIFFDDSVK